jgi:hypothetical protein
MKLTTNTCQRLLGITASASLLGVVGCSNLPRTASNNSAAMYRKSSAQTLESDLAYQPQGWDSGGGGQSQSVSPATSSPGSGAASAASSGGHGGAASSGGHSGGR